MNNGTEVSELASYRIFSRWEISTILQFIRERKQLIRLSIRHGAQTSLTSVLQVDPDGGNVVIDVTSDTALNQELIQANSIRLETVLNNIKIIFDLDRVEECLFEERLAFISSIPSSLIRLQRREYYRVDTPRASPIKCTITAPENNGMISVVFPLENISGGGIALVDKKFGLDVTVGRIYNNCQIALSDNAPLIVKLEIRYARNVKLPNGKDVRVISCRFGALPRAAFSTVQQYIATLEREYRTKSSDA